MEAASERRLPTGTVTFLFTDIARTGDAGARALPARRGRSRDRQRGRWIRSGPFIMGRSDDLVGALAAIDEAIAANRKLGRMHTAAHWLASRAMALRMAEHPDALRMARHAMRNWYEMGYQGRTGFELRRPQGRPREG